MGGAGEVHGRCTGGAWVCWVCIGVGRDSAWGVHAGWTGNGAQRRCTEEVHGRCTGGAWVCWVCMWVGRDS
eukprot:scaffold108120_cov47-Phaeocystis_antarctica.AAC.3